MNIYPCSCRVKLMPYGAISLNHAKEDSGATFEKKGRGLGDGLRE